MSGTIVAFILLIAVLQNFCGAWDLRPRSLNLNIAHSRRLPTSCTSVKENIFDSKPVVVKSSTISKSAKSILGMSGIGLALLLSHPSEVQAATAGFNALIPAGDTGLVQSFLLILLSEIGDKTFFIAALLAAKYGRLISFTGSMGALFAMTAISTIIGQLFHRVPESITKGIPFDDYIACVAFAYFGVKTLVEAFQSSDGSTSGIEEEKAEAEEIVNEVSAANKRNSIIALILQTFSLVFAAEIGDRSFLSTIALSAALNPYAVASGALMAHAVATGVAVLGGAILSKYLSEKVIAYIGGTLFLVFAVTTAFGLF